MEILNNKISYNRAKKKVKKIKGFYIHLVIYIIFNTIFLVRNIQDHGVEGLLYTMIGTGFFWGIGLFFHWYGVFGKSLFFKEWENRKIKELMDEDKPI